MPFAELEAEVAAEAGRLAAIPLSQLSAMKLIVNQAYENMGLASTQTLGPILDGLMRNTPDAEEFIALAESEGVGAAVERRDGPFGDYSQAPASAAAEPGERDRAVSEGAFRAVWEERSEDWCAPCWRPSPPGARVAASRDRAAETSRSRTGTPAQPARSGFTAP